MRRGMSWMLLSGIGALLAVVVSIGSQSVDMKHTALLYAIILLQIFIDEKRKT